jgi:steroid delta-isomerase-like uncharacterized protein
MTTTVQNKALVTRIYREGFEARNINIFDEVCAEGFVDHNPDPGHPGTRDGAKTMFRGMFEAFPDLKCEINSIVAEGDRVGAHVTMSGTHLGTFNGVPATGRRVKVTGFDWVRVQNGKIAERWGAFDAAGMLAQLGLVPGPSANDLKTMSRRYYEVMDKARGDLAPVKAELLHPQHTAIFTGKPYTDAGALQQLVQGFYAAFPDLTHVVDEQICEGDTVHNRVTVKGTQKGDFAGIKPTGRSVSFIAMTSHRYVDGKLYEQRVEVDFVGCLQQLGAMPKPA